LTTTK